MKKILIVGCGLTGATIARILAENGYTDITIMEKRNHIAGNCYDYIDEKTNIRVNKYGAHIFHTNDSEVFDFTARFTDWIPYFHKVKAKCNDIYVPIPVNIDTVNNIFNININTEEEMLTWMKSQQVMYEHIKNSEEMAKSRVGETLYNLLFKEYTKKQWNKYPEELDSSVLKRIPVRYDFNENYFSDIYQCIPKNGYTAMVHNMINHPYIHIQLNCDFFNVINKNSYSTIFYTGPIDTYFHDIGLPSLEYRSINFIHEYVENTYQPYAVVNYPSKDIPYTRSVEYKHFPNQSIDITNSIVVHEKTTDIGEPYYPVPNKRNMDLFEKYQEKACNISNVIFIGRLASYKYINMDQAIRYAMDEAFAFLEKN